jgi:hypothetical protein
MELAQDRVQWRALVLAVLNLRVLLPEIHLISLVCWGNLPFHSTSLVIHHSTPKLYNWHMSLDQNLYKILSTFCTVTIDERTTGWETSRGRISSVRRGSIVRLLL